MNKPHCYLYKLFMISVLYCSSSQVMYAQTDLDGIMLKKNVLCAGAMYSQNTWTDYWEGTFKRDNGNLGKVSMRMYTVMGNYGISDKLNFLFSLPYVTTNATQGTLRGLKGMQDLSLMLKWKPWSKRIGKNDIISVYGIGRISFPVDDYIADYLPLALGMRSKTAGVRAMVDYQHGKLFATASGNYTFRSNIEIDRDAYYTTEMHYTSNVDMPDVTGYNVRAGYRSKNWIVEGVVENMTTLGGFDIRKNDMPFPSNKMNFTQVGAGFKHTMKVVKGLELIGGGRYVISGRNVGQSTTIYGGFFYLMDLSGRNKIKTNINN